MARGDYFSKLRAGTAHPTYKPDEEGYGDAREWASCFNVRMGFKEAQEVRRKSKFTDEWKVLSEFGNFHVDESSVWDDIKKAFRKATMNTHPDRVTQHGKPVDQAEEEFKEVAAAFTMLEDIYRSKGRIK